MELGPALCFPSESFSSYLLELSFWF